MKVKVQARGKGRFKADRTLIYRLYVDEGLTQKQIAERLDTVPSNIYRQQQYLKTSGYIEEIGKTGIFVRGPNAKFYEQAEPILPRVEEPEKNDPPANSHSRHGGAVEGGPSSPSPSGQHDEEVYVPEIGAHMHDGGVMFDIAKVGRIATYTFRDKAGNLKETPLFREAKNAGYHSKWQYDWDFTPEGQPWTAHVQLQVFRPKKKPSHAHLLIDPPRVTKTLEEAEALEEYPLQFFEKEVFDILNHLEKWAGFKFHRESGRRVGKRVGRVVFHTPIPPEVQKIIPPNFKGIEGISLEMDHSPGKGKPEMEAEKLARLTAMLRAKENFEEVRNELANAQAEVESDLAAIDARIQSGEKGLDQVRAFAEKRLFDVYRVVNQVIDALHMVAQVQAASVHVDAIRTAVTTMEGAATAKASPSEEPAPEKQDRYSTFYR